MLNTYKLFKIKFNDEEKEQFNNVISTFSDLLVKELNIQLKN